MKFLDLAKVYIRSGAGGSGCVSFRREKFIEYGGPDGGDGGNGGSVIVRAREGVNNLANIAQRKQWRAEPGRAGQGPQLPPQMQQAIVQLVQQVVGQAVPPPQALEALVDKRISEAHKTLGLPQIPKPQPSRAPGGAGSGTPPPGPPPPRAPAMAPTGFAA